MTIESDRAACEQQAKGSVTSGFRQAMPLDVHNRILVANVHPPEWINPQPAGRYNLVVIGAGTAGLVSAAVAAGLGAKVALIERELMGGDCLNVGCVPSKALIRSARALAEVRRAGDFGVRVSGSVSVDFPAVMERMRRLRSEISSHDSAARFRDLGVDVFLGTGRFVGRDRVEVNGRTLEFARACIATGGRPIDPSIPGLKESGFLTNETLFSLTVLPRRLTVLGAGPIGCELAQCFARFGSEVTLIQRSAGILGREDRDAARLVQESLERDGVRVLFETSVTEVGKRGNSKVLSLEQAGRRRELEVDELLVGVGREPNVQGLGLEQAGVEYDERAGVKVDDHLCTTNPRIYAAGDICSDYKFTHTADAAAGIVIRNALFFGRSKVSALTIPWCTYTDPEIAHVGLYEPQGKAQGLEIDTYTVPMREIDRAVLDGEDQGFLKVHVRKGSDRILGATLVAGHAGEMISEITAVMVAGGGLGSLSGTIHPYPTQAEAIRRAANLYMKTRLTPTAKTWLTRLLAWRRA